MTRIAATSKATAMATQRIAATRKAPSEANSLDSGATSVRGFLVSQKRHTGQETPQIATTRV